jgi:N-acylglucosamine 2-epimerase
VEEQLQQSLKELINQYRDELLSNVIPFWLEHSVDKEYGGFLNSLDRDGTVFYTDKWIWMLYEKE